MAFGSSPPQLSCPGPTPHQKVYWPHTLTSPLHLLQLSHTATPAVSLQCHKDIVFFPLLFSSVQLLSHVQLFASPWTAARQASLPITNSWSLLKLMSIESDAISFIITPMYTYRSCPFTKHLLAYIDTHGNHIELFCVYTFIQLFVLKEFPIYRKAANSTVELKRLK